MRIFPDAARVILDLRRNHDGGAGEGCPTPTGEPENPKFCWCAHKVCGHETDERQVLVTKVAVIVTERWNIPRLKGQGHAGCL